MQAAALMTRYANVCESEYIFVFLHKHEYYHPGVHVAALLSLFTWEKDELYWYTED